MEASALISKLTDAVKHQVDQLFADGVVTTGVVVGGVLLAGDELLRVEQLTVGASSDLIHHRGLQVDEDRPWNVLACSSLTEEGVEGVIAASNGLV